VNVEEVIGSVVSVNVAMPRFRDFPGGLQSKDVSTRSSTYRRRGIAANASANSQRNAGASDTVGSTFSYAGRASLPTISASPGLRLGESCKCASGSSVTSRWVGEAIAPATRRNERASFAPLSGADERRATIHRRASTAPFDNAGTAPAPTCGEEASPAEEMALSVTADT